MAQFEYISAASGTGVYKFYNRATVYVPELERENIDVAGGPLSNIGASGVRMNNDLYFGKQLISGVYT